MDRNWFSKMFLGLEGAEDAKKTFDEVGKAVQGALSTRTPQAFDDALKAVNKGLDDANDKLKALAAQQKATAGTADMGLGESAGPDERSSGIQRSDEAPGSL
jgi:hypothetical protein